jgi:hypothetical protein
MQVCCHECSINEMTLVGRIPLVWGFCVGPSWWAPFVSHLCWKTFGVNRTLCVPRRPAFPNVSLPVSPLPRRLATVETTQLPPASLWCGVSVCSWWAPFVSRLWWKTTSVNRTLCVPRCAAFPNVSLLVSPLPKRLATVETTQCNRRPTLITLQTSPLLPNSDYFPNLSTTGPTRQDGARLTRGV